MTRIAFFAKAGPATSGKFQKVGQQTGEWEHTRLQATDCLVLALRLIAFRNDWWDAAASCTVAVNPLHFYVPVLVFIVDFLVDLAQPKIDFDTYQAGGEAQIYAAARWISGKRPARRCKLGCLATRSYRIRLFRSTSNSDSPLVKSTSLVSWDSNLRRAEDLFMFVMNYITNL